MHISSAVIEVVSTLHERVGKKHAKTRTSVFPDKKAFTGNTIRDKRVGGLGVTLQEERRVERRARKVVASSVRRTRLSGIDGEPVLCCSSNGIWFYFSSYSSCGRTPGR